MALEINMKIKLNVNQSPKHREARVAAAFIKGVLMFIRTKQRCMITVRVTEVVVLASDT